mgnify:FL=1
MEPALFGADYITRKSRDEQGILKTARCAVLPCEMSKRIRPAFAVTE